MEQSEPAVSEMLCALAHDVTNKLGVIAGNCELALEHAGAGSECARRLRLILEIAHSLANRINGSACRMNSSFSAGSARAAAAKHV